MQALSIYLIIKVDEGPTEYDNGLDSLLVAVVVVRQSSFPVTPSLVEL